MGATNFTPSFRGTGGAARSLAIRSRVCRHDVRPGRGFQLYGSVSCDNNAAIHGLYKLNMNLRNTRQLITTGVLFAASFATSAFATNEFPTINRVPDTSVTLPLIATLVAVCYVGAKRRSKSSL